MLIIVALLFKIASTIDGETLFKQGLEHFAATEYQKALNLFSQAIALQPGNVNYLFRRMITYSITNQHKSMMRDLDSILLLNPEKKIALTYRAELNLKLGNLDRADRDYATLKSLGDNVDDKIAMVGEARQGIAAAEKEFARKNFERVIASLEAPIKSCPLTVYLLEMRAHSFEALGDPEKAIMDLRHISSLQPENVELILRLSLLIYEVGNSEQSLKEIKKCLRVDPDHRDCMKHYKLAKRLEKVWGSVLGAESSSDWNGCADIIGREILGGDYNEVTILLGREKLCLCQSKDSQSAELAVQSCSKVLESSPGRVSALYNRGEAHLLLGDFDNAEADFQSVKQKDPHFGGIDQAIKRCHKMKKQASKRDYYKILEVPRSASKSDIVKAYRRLAKVWHPDRYSGADKEMADKKFNDIADAKEVLTNPEMKQKFDSGIDPLDATEHSSGFDGFHGFHGFHEGFTFNFDGFGGGHDFFFNF